MPKRKHELLSTDAGKANPTQTPIIHPDEY